MNARDGFENPVGVNAKEQLAASPEAGFVVEGMSAGANFAGVIAYTAWDAGMSPPITGLFLSIPVALMPQAYHLVTPEWREQLLSLEQNAENPLLTKTSLSQIENELDGCASSLSLRSSPLAGC
ncbi:hypothetical protein GE09DRAFT_1062486 [Coniochaeta sp. 2T2.1]|nr:hypothetical protein GE09DRAFT_1062486 [Coniochaeta sp. 2T2.1]